jgi:hypothetical protein
MYKKSKRCNPYNYDGVQRTNHLLSDLLPNTTQGLSSEKSAQEELLSLTWLELIGKNFAAQCIFCGFQNGYVRVKIVDQALYSLLKTYEKPRLLDGLRKKLPSLFIKDLILEIG